MVRSMVVVVVVVTVDAGRFALPAAILLQLAGALSGECLLARLPAKSPDYTCYGMDSR